MSNKKKLAIALSILFIFSISYISISNTIPLITDKYGDTEEKVYIKFVIPNTPRTSRAVAWSTNGKVISNEVSAQQNPQICTDGSGGAFIVWEDYRDGDNWDIYAQRIDKYGVTWGDANGTVIDDESDDQFNPQICYDGNGSAIIVWEDQSNGDDSNHYIMAQKINSNVEKQWTSDGEYVCTNSELQKDPKICCDGSGGAIIAWLDNRSDTNFDIYAQKINSNGARQWSPTTGVVICDISGIQQNFDICCDGSGGAFIVWEDYRDGDNYDIYALHIDSNGNIDGDANGTAIDNESDDQFNPEICCDGNGNAIMVWEDEHTGSTTDHDIMTQKLDSNGDTQWNANGKWVAYDSDKLTRPQICCDGNGNAIVSFMGNRIDPNYDIFAQKINSSGDRQWETEEGVIICNYTRQQEDPRMCCDGSGGAVITWEDERAGPLEDDIYAQKINSAGATQWDANGTLICNASGQQYSPEICCDGSGRVVITWLDERAGPSEDDVYAQKISEADGLNQLLMFLMAIPTPSEAIPSYSPIIITFSILMSIISIIMIYLKKQGNNLG
jgi:hypothetical protein